VNRINDDLKKQNSAKNTIWNSTKKTFQDSIFYNVLISMRPLQWTKNVFVFAGLIFSRSFFDIEAILKTIYAFFLFSAVSGAMYIINDVIDKERDAIHPLKCKRPVASGKLKPSCALLSAALILIAALYLSYTADRSFFWVIIMYFILILLYSFVLKKYVIIDVIIIAAGFVLRTLGGTAIINVTVSPWLIMCTTFLALFLALNKRKSELALLLENAANHRGNLEEYTPELINQMLPVTQAATIMSYSLYTFSSGKSYYMMATIPFVFYGVFRYQYLVSNKGKGGSPETVILKDIPLSANIILWAVLCLIIVTLFY